MPFKKGNAGRPKGTKNKHPLALKEMILQALSNVGGPEYLQAQAEKNPGAFLTLVGKVLPLQVGADPEGGLKRFILEWQDRPPSTEE